MKLLVYNICMIFKAYDIRGVYGDNLNEDIAYKIGRAFTVYVGSKIVLAHDNRISSEPLLEALKRGIIDQGGDIYDIGLSSSPMFYFATTIIDCDGGIIITASHNPREYNGFKMVRRNAVPLSGDCGINEIKELVLSNNFPEPIKKGSYLIRDISSEYINSFEKKKYNLKVVVDTANSVSGVLVPKMLDNVNLIHMFSDLDGRFPNHNPNPLKEENLKDLRTKVVEEKADLGVAFDGDGDRVFFVDELGNIISSDLIVALISSLNPDWKILYDIRCSNIVRETAKQGIASRIGHSFIKAEMEKEDIPFGGEYSGHYYLKQGNAYFESPYFVIYSLLEAIKDKKISELISGFRKYYHSGEINFKVSDKDKVIREIEQKYSDGEICRLDGLRIDFNDWWMLVRASNTEPVLRLIVEAKNEQLLKEKIKELTPFFS